MHFLNKICNIKPKDEVSKSKQKIIIVTNVLAKNSNEIALYKH